MLLRRLEGQHIRQTYFCQLLSGWRILMLGFTINLLLLHWTSSTVVNALTAAAAVTATTSKADVPIRKLFVVRGENASIACRSDDNSKIWFYERNQQHEIRQPSSDILLIESDTAVLIVRNVAEPSIYECRSGYSLLAETTVVIDQSTRKLELGLGDVASLICNSYDSKRTYFYEVSTKRYFHQSSFSDIITVDDYTSVLLIRNASAQKSNYLCMIDRTVINDTRVYVGTPPQNITDFKCRVFDYVNMTCTFTRPLNMLYTEYRIRYTIGSTPENIYNCEIYESDNILKINLLNQPNNCMYLPSQNFYNFKLIGENTLGSNSQFITVNNHRSVVPQKVNMNITHITNDSVTLAWKINNFFYYRQGLIYDLELRPRGITENLVSYKGQPINCDNHTNCWTTLRNLKYPFWEYNLTVRAHTNISGDANNDDLWSEPFRISFVTMPRRPDRPPNTAFGSFYIDPKEVEIRLYWEQLSKYEENGANFHYHISEIDEHGNILNNTKTKESSIVFPWQRNNRIFSIRSANDEGESEDESIVRAFSLHKDDAYTPTTIRRLYHNDGTYTLSWKEPIQLRYLTNYTVFWCEARIESLNQCNGSIQFRYLDRNQNMFTTEPQDHTLILALSANYPDWSTGMHWVKCSAAESVDLVKLEPEAKATSATDIVVSWSTEHICTSVIEGYNISYCRIADATNTQQAQLIEDVWGDDIDDVDNSHEIDCISKISTVKLTGNETENKNFLIQNLKPYSMYRIEMLMYSQLKVGPMSDPVYVVTAEAASSAPRDLRVDNNSVTSNSAKISWSPPSERNGHLRNYTIWLRTNGHIRKENVNLDEHNISEKSNVSYTLIGLSSYLNYEIYITAYTVALSPPSTSVEFKTLIGKPSQPRNVTIIGDGSTKRLEWVDPAKPSGRVEVYEIALVTTYAKNKTGNSNNFNTENVEEITYVAGSIGNSKHSCSFQAPECSGATYSYSLRVRAINIITESEVDKTTFNIEPLLKNQQEHSRMTSGFNASSTIYADPNSTGVSKTKAFTDIRANSITPYSLPLSEFKCDLVDHNVDESIIERLRLAKYYGLESLWEVSENRIQCAETTWDYVLYIAFGMCFICALLASLYWVHRKYNEMKNIEAILPEGLLHHMTTNAKISNSGNMGHTYDNTEKELPEISNSFDFLTSKEGSHLLIFRNALNSLTPTGSENGDSDISTSRKHSNSSQEEGINEPKDVLQPFRKAEQSSDNTDTIELNDNSSTSYQPSPLKINAPNNENPGYVTLPANHFNTNSMVDIEDKQVIEELQPIVHSNDIDMTYISLPPVEHAHEASTTRIENNLQQERREDGTKTEANERALNFSGYVTPATLMLAESVSVIQPPSQTTFQSAPTNTPMPMTNGYVLPETMLRLKSQSPIANQQPTTTSNGYITLDALGDKLIAQPRVGSRMAQTSLPETSIAAKLHNTTSPMSGEDNVHQRQSHNIDQSICIDNNNRSDIISGYVSQRQLAEFGQLVQ